MNRSKVLTSAMALGMAMIIGASGSAFAYPGNHGWGGQQMTQEQQTALQEIYSEHNKQCAPLQRQLMAKRSELDALYYGQNADSGKVQGLHREIADIEAKLFTADAELRKKLNDKGLVSGGFAMHHGGEMFDGQGPHHGGGRNGGGWPMHGGGHGGGHW